MRFAVPFAAALLATTATAQGGFALPAGAPLDFAGFGVGLLAQANNA